MSVAYRAVGWSPHKRLYDAIIAACVVAFVLLFIGASKLFSPFASSTSDEILVMRALGTCAITLLHIILIIGPLARLSPRWLPVLYNRRHLGVLTFLIALAHGLLALGYYHGFAAVNPLVSLLTSATHPRTFQAVPFQVVGLTSLFTLFMLAATSHDFWLRFLGPRAWKALHMGVYLAYAQLLFHVAMGAMQSRESLPLTAIALGFGLTLVSSLHIAAGIVERRREQRSAHARTAEAEWIDAGPVRDIAPERARPLVLPTGERVAVIRHNDRISAIAGVCAHQGGPLAEGKVIDGCLTCPWHGWQYQPHDGCAPPPFVEQLATYPVRIVAGRAQVRSTPLKPGTATPPAPIKGDTTKAEPVESQRGAS